MKMPEGIHTKSDGTPLHADSSKGLLLHICCGPCASGCFQRLEENGRKYAFYFSNSNLNSLQEYEKRLAAAEKLANAIHAELLTDPYRHDLWLEHIRQCENYAEQKERGLRCGYCFEYALSRTARKALELGMNFATSLTVSPHKDSGRIFAIGRNWSHFECWDFKKKGGFLLSLENSRAFGLYRQDFCGCEFSLRKTDLPPA